MINIEKLTSELKAAGIQISGCSDGGIVWGADGTTEIQDQPSVAEVILRHDPEAPTAAETARANALAGARVHNGIDIKNIPMPDMSDIIRALCAEHGWVNEAGEIQIPE